MRSRSLGTTAIIALALGASVAVAQPVRVGSPAPNIDLPTLAGGRVRLAQLRGQPIVVSFWGSWCLPCRSEFPELVRAHREHAGGLYVLGVNGRDQELSTKDVQKFVDEFSVPFQVALDTRGKAQRTYRLRGLPTTVFIDSGGVVQRIHIGPISRAELESGITAILPVH